MRTIRAESVIEPVKLLCMDANYNLGDDVVDALKKFYEAEESSTAKSILQQILKNAEIALNEQMPICQDTGFAVYFVEKGVDLCIEGDLTQAINEGTRQGYIEGYLRKSIVEDPLRRVNTKDNTPAVIWYEDVPGGQLRITLAPKGGGSENMSEIRMLKPSDGAEGLIDYVVDRVDRSGANPCPPIIVGVGVGGTYEKCAYIAKKSLLRKVGSTHPDPFYARMEDEMLERINKLGIGPQGFGGRTTALDVFIEAHPCHIASLPAAVNIQCHAARHKSFTI
ncbi:MAG: fumarate hydratase [candidate division Zixibacteria bacterium]|nr:fumarate hydratase [Candidatus Tariuqbacter arcticus]